MKNEASQKELMELLSIENPRSDKWPTVRKHHLKTQGWCMMCGSVNDLQTHHIQPFHLHPDLELDPSNLITLCETLGIECHLRHGHLGNWKNFNSDIVKQATSTGAGNPSQFYVEQQNNINKVIKEGIDKKIAYQVSLEPIAPITNRFFNIPSILSSELMPWKIQSLGMDATHPEFELQTPIRFRSDIAGGVIVVPYGFISDLASIPEALQNLLNNDDPRISAGAWIHDLLCVNKGFVTKEDGSTCQLTHTDCAKILAFEAMADLGADKGIQDAVYLAVVTFGPKF